jgi:hypothetical protein
MSVNEDSESSSLKDSSVSVSNDRDETSSIKDVLLETVTSLF